MKGHKFEHIVVNFEAYKIMCKAPNAVLQRITEKPSWTSPRHYYNDYQDPKWLVPLAEAFEHTKNGWYRPASREHCIYGGISEEKIVEARRRAKSYVAGLLSAGISAAETIKEAQRNHK